MGHTIKSNPLFRSGFLALAVLGLATSTADAGIVITTKGKVFIGTIDSDSFKDDKGKICAKEDYASITVRRPQRYKGEPAIRGEIAFPKYEVRWYDANSEEPTDEYMKLYADAELDPKWYALYVAPWKEARDNQVQVQPLTSFADFKSGSLSVMSIPRKWGADEASIRRPTGWSQTEQGGITIFQSDQKLSDGYQPRIHFFSTEAAIGQPSDQLAWIKQELEKAASTPDSFEVRGDAAPKSVRGGYDVELTTTTRRAGKSIKALRSIKLREHRAYFVTCYSHEKDFDKHQVIFHQVISSLSINEAGKTEGQPDLPDVSSVAVGQTFRWKSQNIPDEVVWEIVTKDLTAIRHKTTKTTGDGSKQVREEPENIVPIDAVARLTAICAAPASPQKVGKESLSISNVTYDCDVYEAAANGKKYKLWLSKKFPVEIKLTVDGQLVKELAEIK
ncbi:MAG: hypothetical protein ACAI25_12395 [Planctomycetota bacterium]